MATRPRNNRYRYIPCVANRSGYTAPPAMTALAPLTATLAAAGAVGRLIADINPTGGTPPYAFAIVANPQNAAVNINPNDGKIVSTADPIGTAGVKNVSVKATDGYGLTLTNVCAVTLT
jgi:hypothetical protein